MRSTNFIRHSFGLLVLLLFLSSSIKAVTSYYFFVQFSNKNNSPYSLSNPAEYLSDRSIARRTYFSIPVDSTDLPINPAYINQLTNLGIKIHCRSKWMNAVTVLLTDSSLMSQVRAMTFVKKVQYTGKLVGAVAAPRKVPSSVNTTNYGSADAQITQLNGKYLHNLGYKGKDIQIGVLDAGFYNVNINQAFDSLRLQGRLLGTKDIAVPNSNIYAEDYHGANVLSTMAGNLPNRFLGTAPDASYWLIRTEYADTEYLVETDFWCAGVEFADSVGVDAINSSLGYCTFDDASMNFTYNDMNGRVARSSIAATMAAQKGILVVVSAGNEGDVTWHYIGTPADAEGILTVGAVTSKGVSTSFSSFGPSSDNRVKPELCATGGSSAIVNTNGSTSTSSGTSFSSPILCGMMACFLQASKVLSPSCNINTLLNTVFGSGSLFNSPTSQQGYGIPNFQTALSRLPFTNAVKMLETKELAIAYNTSDKTIHIRLHDSQLATNETVRVYSITGSLQLQQRLTEPETILQASKLSSGMYLINISGTGKSITSKIVVK